MSDLNGRVLIGARVYKASINSKLNVCIGNDRRGIVARDLNFHFTS